MATSAVRACIRRGTGAPGRVFPHTGRRQFPAFDQRQFAGIRPDTGSLNRLFSKPGRRQLPALDQRQFAGCIDSARIGPVAVDQSAVAAAPPGRHGDRIDQLAQAHGFVFHLSRERCGPHVEQPENRLAGRRPSPFDRECAAAKQADG